RRGAHFHRNAALDPAWRGTGLRLPHRARGKTYAGAEAAISVPLRRASLQRHDTPRQKVGAGCALRAIQVLYAPAFRRRAGYDMERLNELSASEAVRRLSAR